MILSVSNSRSGLPKKLREQSTCGTLFIHGSTYAKISQNSSCQKQLHFKQASHRMTIIGWCWNQVQRDRTHRYAPAGRAYVLGCGDIKRWAQNIIWDPNNTRFLHSVQTSKINHCTQFMRAEPSALAHFYRHMS